MAGDPTNARLWANADVFVSFDLEATNPATVNDEFGVDWDLIGLLDGDAGFVDESAFATDNDLFAWGGILVRTSRINYKDTRTFTALEPANSSVRRLRYPGSEADEIRVPQIERVKIALETREGSVVHRRITKYQSEVVPDGSVTESEAELAGIPFRITTFPDSDGRLFVVQDGTLTSS